jgi:hypothetical protein
MKTRMTIVSGGKKILLALAGVGLLCPVPLARAQSAKLEIGHLDKLADKASEVVDVTIDGSLLQLAARFMSDKRDPEEAAAKQMVQRLKGIYVRVYEFDKEGEYSQADVEEIRKQLHSPNWQRTVEVRSKRGGDNAEIYLMPGSGTGADAIQGIAILCAEPKELTVVNIVGPIDLDKLADLDGEMGMPHLGLERSGKHHKPEKDGKELKDGKDSKEAQHHDETE